MQHAHRHPVRRAALRATQSTLRRWPLRARAYGMGLLHVALAPALVRLNSANPKGCLRLNALARRYWMAPEVVQSPGCAYPAAPCQL